MSTPVLSLLVALISVLSLAAPTLIDALTHPRSKIAIAFQYFEDGTAYFVASNSGDRPGSVGEVYFDYGKTEERYVLRGDPTKRYVAPGTSQQLAFRLPCSQDLGPQTQYAEDPKRGSRPIAKDARLNIVLVQFNGQSETVTVPVGVLSGIRVLNDRLSQCLDAKLKEAAKR